MAKKTSKKKKIVSNAIKGFLQKSGSKKQTPIYTPEVDSFIRGLDKQQRQNHFDKWRDKRKRWQGGFGATTLA